MVDLLTIGGIAAVIVVVIAACFAIHKMLSRGDTFDEAYPNDALKLLTSNKENVENKNKAKNKRHHHPKRPKAEAVAASAGQQKQEAKNEVDEPKTEEQANENEMVTPKPKLNGEASSGKKQQEQKNNKKTKGSSSAQRQQQQQIEEVKIEETIQQKMAEPVNAANNGMEQEIANGINDGNNEQPTLPEADKNAVDVLRELIKGSRADKLKLEKEKRQMAVELNQFRAQNEQLEKGKKQMTAELDQLRTQNEQLAKENREQKDRHVVFEQTVRNKLIETVQLKEENKKLSESIAQLNAKATQQIEQMKQKMAGIQSETLQAQEERNLTKNYAEKLMADMRGMQMNFDRQTQGLQAELNKEREHRIKVEQEFNMAKQMINNLTSDLANKEENAMRETDQFRAAYEAKLREMQNELNREKDASQSWKNAGSAAEQQIAEMNREMEKTMAVYQSVKAQHEKESAKLAEMAVMNQKLEEELGKQRELANTQSQNSKEVDELKSSITNLNNCLEDQRARNNDLRETNFKLHETIVQLQEEKENAQLVNGVAGKQQQENGPTGTNQAEQRAEIEQLMAENKQYKHSLDNLNSQLEEVSRIAREMEREKDEKIAQIEAKLTKLLDTQS